MSLVRSNAERDPAYCPYCMRCSRMGRMQPVQPFWWRCDCGAECDLRTPADLWRRFVECRDADQGTYPRRFWQPREMFFSECQCRYWEWRDFRRPYKFRIWRLRHAPVYARMRAHCHYTPILPARTLQALLDHISNRV